VSYTRNAGNLHPFSIVGALESAEDARENDSSESAKEATMVEAIVNRREKSEPTETLNGRGI
jgi:hypothetical protein